MDHNRFDDLVRVLSWSDSRRRVLGLLAMVPVMGGLLDMLSPEETEAAGRRKRRKQAHQHGRGRRRNTHKPKKRCTPESASQTCAGKCGSVANNCKQPVDCGSCDCAAACETCFICQGTDGAPSRCVPQASGTSCGSNPTICESGTLLPQDNCNGRGTCEPGIPTPCVPYTHCAGNACSTSCTDDDGCVAGSFCNDVGQCVGDLPSGERCDHSGQCTSGFCVGGVCCNEVCNGSCQTCNATGSVGTCTNEPDRLPCGSGNFCCGGQCVDPSNDLFGPCECPANTHLCPAGTCKPYCDSDLDLYWNRFQSCFRPGGERPGDCDYCIRRAGCYGLMASGTTCGYVSGGCAAEPPEAS